MDSEKPKVAIKPWVLKSLQNKAGASVLSQVTEEATKPQTNEIASEQHEQVDSNIADRFRVNLDDYEIFSQQGGVRENETTKKLESRTLCIDETMSLMVGRTAQTIAVLAGEVERIPAADEVVYLDKSARPVSWLVNEFWQDFTSKQKPEESFFGNR